MFAVLFHESMNPFYQTISSFPTVIYTVLLIVCTLYWAVAVLGLVDLEILDVDLDGDISAADSDTILESIAGVLHKLGLAGVPLTIVITIISVIGWLICYYTTYFGTHLLPNLVLVKFIAALITFVVATYITILITAQVIKPLRSMFARLNYDETKHILGQSVVVRSSTVTTENGEAELYDGGAGLLLNIRSTGSDVFSKGDEVVIIEQLQQQNLYRVVAKSEFSGDV